MKHILLLLLTFQLELGQNEDFSSIAKQKSESSTFSVNGEDKDWYFLPAELKHLARGTYWTNFEKIGIQDPTEIIVKYASGIKALGAELLLVPVPAKASIYPEKLTASETKPASPLPFYKSLSNSGVNLLDLEPLFLEAKKQDTAIYCQQDSHWTPFACEIVAKKIKELYPDITTSKLIDNLTKTENEAIDIHGDLIEEEKKPNTQKEKLTISYIGTKTDTKPTPIKKDPNSPILLLGDSHTLVFSEGPNTGMHAFGGGLFDHITKEYGFAPDRHANKGSGGHIARIDVARRAKKDPEFWKQKQLVIWVFSAREFTEGKWKPIPAQP